jgi:hypothetical protein
MLIDFILILTFDNKFEQAFLIPVGLSWHNLTSLHNRVIYPFLLSQDSGKLR